MKRLFIALILAAFVAATAPIPSWAATTAQNLAITVTNGGTGGSPFQHVVLVMEENTDYSYINSTNTPNMDAFASSYGKAVNFFSNTHPSIGTYFIHTTGQALTNDDNQNPTTAPLFPYNGDNLIRHLNSASLSWKGYAESLPSTCYFGGNSGNYAPRHFPIVYFTDVQNSCANRVVEFFDTSLGFQHDITNNTLPAFSYVTPNVNDDGHSGTLAAMDTWVQTNVIAPLKANSTLWNNTLLIIAFDESGVPPASSAIDDSTDGGGQVWVALGSGQSKAAYQSTAYCHTQCLLRWILEGLGQPYNFISIGPTYSANEYFVPATPEEFAGPFANWSNAKTTYGAAGNGSTDDTTALQSCITNAATSTCFIPAGNYKLSAQLTMSMLYGNIIGADPATTCIFWAGSAGGTMLRLNGTGYSKISRLTFNGANSSTCASGTASAAVAIDQSWDGTTGNSDTTNEYSDVVLANTTSVGFRCGALNNQCSEISLLRDKFTSVVNGISMGNANALDVWCWYCQFLNLSRGMTNNVSGSTAGNGSVFASIFQNSSVADLDFGNTEVSTYSWNYSTGSARFRNGGGGGNPDNIVMQGNYVAPTGGTAVNMGNWGPLVLLDNTFLSPGSSTPVISVSNTGNVFSQGNVYTAGTVGSCGSSAAVNGTGHCHSVVSTISAGSFDHTGDAGDVVLTGSTINRAAPTLPSTPANKGRSIQEVVSAGAIQAAINTACAGATRSVVHIQANTYNIGSTLTVPANCTAQIIGDGIGRTVLSWSGSSGGTILQLASPAKAVIRDMEFHGGSNAVGIDIKGADQIGASVWGQGLLIDSSTTTDFFSDSLDNTYTELRDTQFAANVTSVPVGLGVKGGALAAAGNWQGGSTNLFSGAMFGHTNGFQITSNGHLSVRQVFVDAGGNPSVNIASESGTGGALSLATLTTNVTASADAVVLNNFTGTSAILEMDNNNTGSFGNGRETISGTGTGANNLNLGNVAAVSPFNYTGTASTNGFLNGFIYPTGQQTESGTSTHPFLKTTLAQLRNTAPTVPLGTPAGVTDVRLSRILVLQGNPYGIHVEH